MILIVFQIFVASRLNVPGAWQMPQVSDLTLCTNIFNIYSYYLDKL